MMIVWIICVLIFYFYCILFETMSIHAYYLNFVFASLNKQLILLNSMQLVTLSLSKDPLVTHDLEIARHLVLGSFSKKPLPSVSRKWKNEERHEPGVRANHRRLHNSAPRRPGRRLLRLGICNFWSSTNRSWWRFSVGSYFHHGLIYDEREFWNRFLWRIERLTRRVRVLRCGVVGRVGLRFSISHLWTWL